MTIDLQCRSSQRVPSLQGSRRCPKHGSLSVAIAAIPMIEESSDPSRVPRKYLWLATYSIPSTQQCPPTKLQDLFVMLGPGLGRENHPGAHLASEDLSCQATFEKKSETSFAERSLNWADAVQCRQCQEERSCALQRNLPLRKR